MTKEQLEQVLVENKWDVKVAAEIIGITKSSVYKNIKKFRLRRPSEYVKGNWNRLKTHCRQGHEYSMENTFVNKFGYRVCKLCKTASSAPTRPVCYTCGTENTTEYHLSTWFCKGCWDAWEAAR